MNIRHILVLLIGFALVFPSAMIADSPPLTDEAINKLAKELAAMNSQLAAATDAYSKSLVLVKTENQRMGLMGATSFWVPVGTVADIAGYKRAGKTEGMALYEMAKSSPVLTEVAVHGFKYNPSDLPTSAYIAVPVSDIDMRIGPKPASGISAQENAYFEYFRDKLLALRDTMAQHGISLKEFTVELGVPPKISATFSMAK